jgi:hypothetical protein
MKFTKLSLDGYLLVFSNFQQLNNITAPKAAAFRDVIVP